MSEDRKEFNLDNEVVEMNIKISTAINPLTVKKIPIAVLLLEQYAEALKKDPHFSDRGYQYLKSNFVSVPITASGDEETMKKIMNALKEGTL